MPLSTIPLASAVSGTLPDGSAPSGSVIQVVNVIKTDGFSANVLGQQYVSVTGLSASITPISASNRILLLASVVFSVQDSSYQSLGGVRIARGGTAVGTGNLGFSSGIASVTSADNFSAYASVPLLVLDTPNTTSPITYDIQITQNITGGATRVVQVNRNRGGDLVGASSFVVMEIAA